MAYIVQQWNNGDPSTPLSAPRLTHLEEGISALSQALGDLKIRKMTQAQYDAIPTPRPTDTVYLVS